MQMWRNGYTGLGSRSNPPTQWATSAEICQQLGAAVLKDTAWGRKMKSTGGGPDTVIKEIKRAMQPAPAAGELLGDEQLELLHTVRSALKKLLTNQRKMASQMNAIDEEGLEGLIVSSSSEEEDSDVDMQCEEDDDM